MSAANFNWQFFHAPVSGYSLKNYNVLLPLLLPHLHFNPSNTLHLEFLDIINGSLVKMYPPTSEDIVVALPILKGVARAIEGCESENIVKFLVILRDCLALWIRDEAQALLESDHSTIVRCYLICFYFLWTLFFGIGPLDLLYLSHSAYHLITVSPYITSTLLFPFFLI